MERSEIAEIICEPLQVSLTTKQDGSLFPVARSNRLCLIPPLQRSTFKDLLDYAALQTFVGILSRLHQAISQAA